jgi:hypothetical protein
MAFVMDKLAKEKIDAPYLIKLHRAVFGAPGAQRARKSNLRDFAGLDGSTRTRDQVLAALLRMNKTELLSTVRLLDVQLDRTAPKEKVAEDTADWLARPTDSGRRVPKKKAKKAKTTTKGAKGKSTVKKAAKKAKRVTKEEVEGGDESSADSSSSSSSSDSDNDSDSDTFILAPPKPAPAALSEATVLSLLASRSATIRDMCSTNAVSLRDLYGWIATELKQDVEAVRVHKKAIKEDVHRILSE